jgi:hypothetical protein
VDENVLAHTVGVVRAIDMDDTRVMDFKVSRMRGRDKAFRLCVRVGCLFRLLRLLGPLRRILRYAST